MVWCIAMIYVIENVKLTDLPTHFAKHKLRPVRLERWHRRGLLLWTEKVKE